MTLTPVVTHCPSCKKQHLDENEWATRPHKWHRCVDDSAGKGCGHEWRISSIEGPTVGVLREVTPTPDLIRSIVGEEIVETVPGTGVPPHTTESR